MDTDKPLPLPQLPRTGGRRKIFSRKLSKTAIKKEINVKANLLLQQCVQPEGAIVGNNFELQIQYQDTIYPMVCRSRKKGKYKKWVIGNGWLGFIRINDLKVGDRVTLFQVDSVAVKGSPFVMEVRRDYAHDSHQSGSMSNTREIIDSSLVSTAEMLVELHYSAPSAEASMVSQDFNSSPAASGMIDLNSSPAAGMIDLNSLPSDAQI